MAIDTQEILYMQALDNYPYDIEQCMEKLQYVISANNEHAGAHYLLGRVYAEQISDYKNAKYHYQMALHINHRYAPTYYYYAELLIILDQYDEALNVIDIGLTIAGADKALLNFVKGILYEKYEMYSTAKDLFITAKNLALNNDFRYHMDSQLTRIKSKKKALNKKEASKKTKKK